MKKLIVIGAIFAFVLALPVDSATKKATLINPNGDKVVVVSGSLEAQVYFGKGFVLMTGNEVLGATSGTTHVFPERFLAGFGGAVLATSTTGTTCTLRESDLNKYSVFELTPNTASATWTLPATSTLATLLKNVGDTKSWVFQNATTSTGINTTLAAGTGWNLSGVDTNVDVIAGAAYTARVSQYVQCYRQSNKDIHCNIDEAIAVD